MKLPFGNARGAHASTELLSSYLDHQVTPEERLRVEQHLRTCASCRAELNSLRQTVTLMRSMPRVPVPRAFTLSEAQVGATRRAAAPWYVGTARALGAVAAVLVVAAVAVLLLRQPGQQAAAPSVAWVAQPAAAPASQQAAAPSSLPATAQEAAPAASATEPGTASSPQPTLGTLNTQPPAPTLPALAQAPAAKAAPTSAPRALAPVATSSPRSPTTQAAGGARKVSPSPEPSTATGAPAAAAAPAAALPSATTGQPEQATQPSTEPTLQDQAPMLMAAPPAAPTGILGLGGGGGGGGGRGAAPSSAGEAATLPPPVPLSTLPANVGVIYGDRQTLTAVDAAGTHLVARAPGVSVPVISPDRAWVVYRVQSDATAQIWAARWDGSNPHLLADGANFPAADGKSSGPVQIDRIQFIPQSHTISMLISANSDNAGTPRAELWTVNAESKGPHYALDVSATGDVFFSPDGRMVAILSRGGPSQPQGQLLVAHADGSSPHTVLQFPANVNGFGYPTQVSWLPDGSALWVAIPDPDVLAENGGLNLYRITAQATSPDEAKPVSHVPGLDTFWSPDGRRLAYTQPVAGGNPGDRQLVLAGADGSNPQVYAPVAFGGFLAWSPDSKHFLYFGDSQWSLGAAGQQPVSLGSQDGIREVHWVSAQQVLYLLNQGDHWALITVSGDGKASSLPVIIPFDAEVSVTVR